MAASEGSCWENGGRWRRSRRSSDGRRPRSARQIGSGGGSGATLRLHSSRLYKHGFSYMTGRGRGDPGGVERYEVYGTTRRDYWLGPPWAVLNRKGSRIFLTQSFRQPVNSGKW